MSKNNPLLQTLVDSPTPEAISMWPQTLGWKVLALALVAGLVYYSIKSYRTWQGNAYKRQASKQIEQLALSQDDLSFKLQTLNQVVKRVAAISYGHPSVAALYGESWIQFLIFTTEGKADQMLLSRWQTELYQRGSKLDKADEIGLFEWAKGWVTSHKAHEDFAHSSHRNSEDMSNHEVKYDRV